MVISKERRWPVMGSLLELGNIVDCFPVADQKQPHRSRHGGRIARYDAPWSSMDEGVLERKPELLDRARLIFAGMVCASGDMTKPDLLLCCSSLIHLLSTASRTGGYSVLPVM